MNRHKLYISVFVLLLFAWVNRLPAQTGSFSGRISEKGTGHAMEFVNVMVYDTLTAKLVKGAVSTEDGTFTVNDLPFNRPLQPVFSSMGYTTRQGRVFVLSAQKSAVKGVHIQMETSAKLLKAVTVTGQKRTIEYSLDKKVVNVEQSLVSEGGSAVDVLENVPSVSVDEDGNISMKGSESVTILIDGRPASLSGLGLDQISASNIANIEIISNPSAKYNPEGTSGIINIITKERKNSEINGNINIAASTANRHSVGANVSFGFKKVTLFTNLDVNFRNRVNEGWSDKTSYRSANPLYTQDNIFRETQQKFTRERMGFGGKFQLGTDIRISPNSSLLISGTAERWYNNRNNLNPGTRTYSYFDTTDAVEHDIRFKSTETSSKENMWGAQGALSYKHKFSKPRQEFTIDGTVNYRGPDETTVNSQNLIEYGGLKNDTSYTRQTVSNRRQDINAELQINYFHPFNEHLSLEVGYQGRLQWQKTASGYDSRLNPYQDTAIGFNYISHNHGLYANLGGTYGNFTFQVGGRFEGDFMTATKTACGGARPGKDELSNYKNTFGYRKFRFYPAVHMAYKIGKMQELQLSYSRRVNRPGPWNLDPFVDYSDYPSSIRYGNPNLQPQDIHSVELNYSLFVKQTSIFITGYYRHMDQLIRRYQFEGSQDPTDPDIVFDQIILFSSFRNYAKGDTYGFDFTFEQQLLKWWRMSLSASMHQNFTSDNTLYSPKEGVSYRANFSTTMNLPLDFVLQFSVRYRGPSYWGQTRFDHNVSGELALRKSFLNKKLNLALRVRDLFHTQKWSNTVTGEGFVSQRESRAKGIYSTALFVTLTYKINKGIQDRRLKGAPSSDGESGYSDDI